MGFAFSLVFLTANLKASWPCLSYARLRVLCEFVCLAEGLPCGVALLREIFFDLSGFISARTLSFILRACSAMHLHLRKRKLSLF